MPIHIGLSVKWGNLAFYDTNQDWKTRREHEVKFTGVQGNELEKVDCMFGEIKSKINAQELGYVCIYLNPEYGNKMRKKLVESGLKCGFKNVEFIHEFALIFINALSGTDYKPVNGNVIWIKMGNTFYVWYKNNRKAEYIGKWHTLTSELTDLEKIVAESKLNKGPDVLFCERKIEETKFRKLLPNCQFFNYQFRDNWPNRACVIKSLITLGRTDFSHLDVLNISSTVITLEIGNNKIAEFGYEVNLPAIYYSQKITKTSEKDELKITPINWPVEIFKLPNYDEFYLTFQIDSNEIYSVVFSDHPYECVQSQDNIETDSTIQNVFNRLKSVFC